MVLYELPQIHNGLKNNVMVEVRNQLLSKGYFTSSTNTIGYPRMFFFSPKLLLKDMKKEIFNFYRSAV